MAEECKAFTKNTLAEWAFGKEVASPVHACVHCCKSSSMRIIHMLSYCSTFRHTIQILSGGRVEGFGSRMADSSSCTCESPIPTCSLNANKLFHCVCYCLTFCITIVASSAREAQTEPTPMSDLLEEKPESNRHYLQKGALTKPECCQINKLLHTSTCLYLRFKPIFEFRTDAWIVFAVSRS